MFFGVLTPPPAGRAAACEEQQPPRKVFLARVRGHLVLNDGFRRTTWWKHIRSFSGCLGVVLVSVFCVAVAPEAKANVKTSGSKTSKVLPGQVDDAPATCEQRSRSSEPTRHEIIGEITRAAAVVGVDPVYLTALADKESSLSPTAKAPTSSAEGLFQFINRTWLEVVREFGPNHGLQAEAEQIASAGGKPVVQDDASRERILDLRCDPYLSAAMAAEMLKRDVDTIQARIGRRLKASEYYLPHFFGLADASRFMKALLASPKQIASRLFPEEAKANRALFYASKGRKAKALSVGDLHRKLDRMMTMRLFRYQRMATAS